MKKFLFVPLGVSETPLGFSRKSLEFLPVFGGLLQSVIGASSQESANRSNLRAARETNEMNYQIAKETNQMSQQQFDKNMQWLREQYYDTDNVRRAAEAARRAGFNPALALGNIQPVGSVGSPSPSSFHAAHMESGHVEPVNYADGLSESVGHSVDAYYNNMLKKSEAEKTSYDAQISRANAMTQMRRNVAELRAMRLDNEQRMKNLKKSDKEYEKLSLENESLDWSIKRMLTDWDDMTKQLKYGNRILENQGVGIQLDNALKDIERQFKPALLRASIRLSNAQQKSVLEHLRLIQPQIESMVSEGELVNAKTIAQRLMNGSDAIKFLEDNHLYEMYNKNGITRKGKDFFYMLGDILSHGIVKNIKL